jgi:hypothetical protein
MLRILRVETYKIMHQKRLAIATMALGAFGFLLQAGFYFQGRNPLNGIAHRMKIDPDLVLNAINSTRLIMNSCYYLFLPVLTTMIFAGQIAGERSTGTLRGILTRPVSRASLYSAKFLVSSITLLMVISFFVGFSLIIGVIFFGTHEFMSSPRVFDLMSGGKSSTLSFSEGVYRLALSSGLLTFLLLPTGALAYFFSILFKHTHSAMATTLLLFFASYVLQGLGATDWLPLFSNLRPYLFTTAMEAWIYVFYPVVAWEEILPRAGLLLVYISALLAAGAVYFRYLDLTE